jgi:hypothetical protein
MPRPSLSDRIAELSRAAPRSFDPENEDFGDGTLAKDMGGYEDEDSGGLPIGRSKLRAANADFDMTEQIYASKKVSRKELYAEEEGSSGADSFSRDGSKSGEEGEDISSGSAVESDSEASQADSLYEDETESSSEAEGSGGVFGTIGGESLVKHLYELEVEEEELASRVDIFAEEELTKAKHTRNQRVYLSILLLMSLYLANAYVNACKDALGRFS